MGINFETSRYETLTRAIANKLGVDQEMAGQISWRVLNYFGYENDIIDNALDQDDRKLFYFLQDVAILKTAWEEAILPSGRTWRIFYWFLNEQHISEFADNIKTLSAEPGLYDALPADVWSREGAVQEN